MERPLRLSRMSPLSLSICGYISFGEMIAGQRVMRATFKARGPPIGVCMTGSLMI